MSNCLVTCVRKNPFELSEVHTPVHQGPYTNHYLYSKTLKMLIFFLVTYIRKNPFELSQVHTPVHQGPYTKVHTSTYMYIVKNS